MYYIFWEKRKKFWDGTYRTTRQTDVPLPPLPRHLFASVGWGVLQGYPGHHHTYACTIHIYMM